MQFHRSKFKIPRGLKTTIKANPMAPNPPEAPLQNKHRAAESMIFF